jgi:hypothetical protein
MSVAQPAYQVESPGSKLAENEGAKPLRSAVLLALMFAAVKLILQVGVSLRAQHVGYGIFRDELYYIVCGRRLAWGYLDNQPLIALLARWSDDLFGHERLWAFRLMPSIAGAAKVFLTGLLACSLGGKRAAQALAMILVIGAPEYFGVDSIFSMNCLEPVFWMTAMLAILEIAKAPQARSVRAWWIVFGLAGGLALETKLSAGFFLICLLAALLLTPQRKLLTSRWALIGIGLLLLIEAPNFVWQLERSFPSIQWLVAASREGKDVVLSPGEFLLQQVLVLIPFSAPFWVGGIAWLLFNKAARQFRFAGLTGVLFIGLMMALHAKIYYVVPIYPVLFAAGCVWCFRLVPAKWQAAPLVYGSVFSTAVWLWLPLVLPIVPPSHYSVWEKRMHYRPAETENFRQSKLPQLLADQTSWPQFVQQVAAAYNHLPADVRARTGIYCGNYGEASAIDVLGPAYGLPPAISGSQTYWFWGPRGQLKDNMLVVNQTRADLEKTFRSVQPVGTVNTPDAMPFEDGATIWLGRGLTRTVDEIWPTTKNWY